ncbi:fluoride efflux transporter CrcB [Bacillus aerolatus]|uniref:fluoride efflux transporter CrcB n=1 Tax=Bacillus aerolatus TaxID=2653354 RepID=UPI001781B16C|nr:fluoride efflux transporter CrcB [Bacillus aerolatus]
MNVWYVALGGAIGATLRYFFSMLNNSLFPFGTLAINIAGSFLLGGITALYMTKKFKKEQLLFYGTGFCGGFTTLSTFSKETVELIQINAVHGVIYVMVSVAGGIAAGMAGLWLGSGKKKGAGVWTSSL